MVLVRVKAQKRCGVFGTEVQVLKHVALYMF